MFNTRRFGALVMAAGLSVSLVACGDDDEDTTASPETTAVAEADTATTMAEGADDMAQGDDVAAGPVGAACGTVPTEGEGSFTGMADDPAATAASNNPALSTLVTAVTEADLVDTLNGPGPFTIFAPVNEAFASIPEADLNALLADKDALTAVLTTHVVAGQMSAADLMTMDSLETVAGNTITLAVEGETLMVNGQASVVCANIPTANATVHLIDAVLMAEAA